MGGGLRFAGLSRTKRKDNKNEKLTSKKFKQFKILLAHDNRVGYHTTKAHNFAKALNENPKFKILYDQDMFDRNEKTSDTEINRREKIMVEEVDIIVRIVPPPSLTGQERHEGAISEIRKAINAGKPVIEIFERGARNSPNRSLPEKNYNKRVEIHLKPGEHLYSAFIRGMDELKKRGII